jgi:hypothetical protein
MKPFSAKSATGLWLANRGSAAAGGTTQRLSVGGDAAGVAQVAGSSNTVTMTGSVSTGVPPDVQQALLAIQATLSAQPATRR